MTANFKTIAGIVILASVVGLTGCSSSGGNNAGANTSTAASPAATADAAAAAPDDASQPESSASPAPAAAPATSPENTGAGSGTAASAGAQDSSALLKELLQLAKQGKVPGVEYAAHSGLIDDVEAAWGEPDTKESAGKGIYSTYSAKHVVFGVNKGSQIFDVRSSADDLQQLTLKEIEQALGKPDNTTTNGGDKIYIYQAGGQYQLKFIIPESTGKVDHISVFSEQDSINNMAG